MSSPKRATNHEETVDEALPLRHSALLFAVVAVVQAALHIIGGGLTAADLITLWLTSLVMVAMFNLGYWVRMRWGDPANLDERDSTIMNRAIAAGFLTIIASVPVVLTYQGLQTTTVTPELVPGMDVVIVVAGVLELRHRSVV